MSGFERIRVGVPISEALDTFFFVGAITEVYFLVIVALLPT